MTKLLLVVGLCSLIPGANAQQATMGEPPTSTSRPETGPASQPAAQEPAAENQIPPELRPGHALDPADVDILTGKRDREIEAARQTAALAAIPNEKIPMLFKKSYKWDRKDVLGILGKVKEMGLRASCGYI